jgi:hypothetical protein
MAGDDRGPEIDHDDRDVRPSMAPVAGHVAMLPPARPGRRRACLAPVVAVAVVAGVAVLPRFSGIGGSASQSASTEAAATNEKDTVERWPRAIDPFMGCA